MKIGYRNSQEWYDLSYDKMRVSKNGFIIDGYDEVYPLENVKFNWGTPFGTVALKMDYKTFHRFLEPKLKPKMVNPWKFKKPTSGGSLPMGTVLSFAGEQVPAGYLECDGRLLKKNEYPKLFNVL